MLLLLPTLLASDSSSSWVAPPSPLSLSPLLFLSLAQLSSLSPAPPSPRPPFPRLPATTQQPRCTLFRALGGGGGCLIPSRRGALEGSGVSGGGLRRNVASPELAAAPDLSSLRLRIRIRIVGLDDVSVKVASDGALTGLCL
uniref:Uncharacterized protein n=1 Tax=Oryza punctata TaxID=4537 RepID=A0A0E0MMD4_ORYPU